MWERRLPALSEAEGSRRLMTPAGGRHSHEDETR